jgi:hypothetical protein
MAFLAPRPRPWAKRGPKGRCWVGSVLAALLLSFALDAPAQTPPSKEYSVKAVFLFNFAQFVEWPSDAFASGQTPLIIGILGDDPFGAYLDQTVRGEKVNSHPLVVRRFHRVEDITTCHVLFISRSEMNRLEQILNGLKGRNVLTVGDANGFAVEGGVIQLVTENNKIRMRINLGAAKAADLTISSKLLRPAEIVEPPKG